MATKKSENEVAVTQNAVVSTIPDFLSGGDFGGGGFEGTDKDSYAIPFISILQKMSPQVDSDDPKYIEGAKAGFFLNSVTGKLYDGKVGLLFVPCSFRRIYIQWGGREGDEKGFKGEFTPEQIDAMKAEGKIVEQDGKLYKPNPDGSINEKKNDRYEDTRVHYVMVVDEETGEYANAIISLSSSQIKASKMLMTLLSQKKIKTASGMKTPPTFANIVRATTTGMTNDKGTWSGASFDLVDLIKDQDLFKAALEFHKQVVGGDVKADYSKAPSQEAGADEAPKEADKF